MALSDCQIRRFTFGDTAQKLMPGKNFLTFFKKIQNCVARRIRITFFQEHLGVFEIRFKLVGAVGWHKRPASGRIVTHPGRDRLILRFFRTIRLRTVAGGHGGLGSVWASGSNLANGP
jgi:hypothetical protein